MNYGVAAGNSLSVRCFLLLLADSFAKCYIIRNVTSLSLDSYVACVDSIKIEIPFYLDLYVFTCDFGRGRK